MPYKTFAEAAKGHRLAAGLSLRKFCLLFEFEPGNLSKIERGLMPPPKRAGLEIYASALGLVDDDVRQEFFDLAAAAKGEFPEDLRDEELVRQLPALFRAIRGDPPNDQEVERLIRLLRKRTDGQEQTTDGTKITNSEGS